jgi:hypothetical protein
MGEKLKTLVMRCVTWKRKVGRGIFGLRHANIISC